MAAEGEDESSVGSDAGGFDEDMSWHYVDVDLRPSDSAKVTLAIRPFAPLAPKARYVVAVRGVRTASGAEARIRRTGTGASRTTDSATDPKVT